MTESISVTNIVQAVYYTLVIVGAAWALNRHALSHTRLAVTAITEAAQGVLREAVTTEARHTSHERRLDTIEAALMRQEHQYEEICSLMREQVRRLDDLMHSLLETKRS